MLCFIVDDSAHFLEAARTLLERQGLTVVGTARSAEEAIRQARDLKPDVTLVDVDLGPDDGIELVRRLSEECSGGRLILISATPREELDELIDMSAAAGFIRKTDLSAVSIGRLLTE